MRQNILCFIADGANITLQINSLLHDPFYCWKSKNAISHELFYRQSRQLAMNHVYSGCVRQPLLISTNQATILYITVAALVVLQQLIENVGSHNVFCPQIHQFATYHDCTCRAGQPCLQLRAKLLYIMISCLVVPQQLIENVPCHKMDF